LQRCAWRHPYLPQGLPQQDDLPWLQASVCSSTCPHFYFILGLQLFIQPKSLYIDVFGTSRWCNSHKGYWPFGQSQVLCRMICW
jgi:hypothetical protein